MLAVIQVGPALVQPSADLRPWNANRLSQGASLGSQESLTWALMVGLTAMRNGVTSGCAIRRKMK